jgi:hypothetical protein
MSSICADELVLVIGEAEQMSGTLIPRLPGTHESLQKHSSIQVGPALLRTRVRVLLDLEMKVVVRPIVWLTSMIHSGVWISSGSGRLVLELVLMLRMGGKGKGKARGRGLRGVVVGGGVDECTKIHLGGQMGGGGVVGGPAEDVLENLKLQERSVEGGVVLHSHDVLAEDEAHGVVLLEAQHVVRGGHASGSQLG